MVHIFIVYQELQAFRVVHVASCNLAWLLGSRGINRGYLRSGIGGLGLSMLIFYSIVQQYVF